MQKSTKGALAAASAAVLLMGGAGTLAYWNATAPGAGNLDLQAGNLTIINNTCEDTTGPAAWTFDADEATASKPYVAGDLLVPGDTLTKDCTFSVLSSGEHLRANFDVVNPTLTGALATSGPLTVSSAFTLDGTPITGGTAELTEGTHPVTVSMTVEFPYGTVADNGSQGDTASLTDYTVTVTQVHN